MSFLSRIFRYESRKSDLNSELRSHLEMAVADRTAQGESPEEARAAAQREFGNMPLIEDVTRATWGWLWLERIVQDLAYAFRQLRRSPGFAISVIGTLALGIAAATAMFTVVDHVLLRPLPYSDPDRLVAIDEIDPQNQTHIDALWQDIVAWQSQSRSFEQFAYFRAMEGRNFLRRGGEALQVSGTSVSANFFSLLGMQPALGQTFIPVPISSTAGQNAGTIVLSDAVWRQALSADPAIVGKSVTINNTSYTVIAVMPPGFEFQSAGKYPAVWTAIELGEHDKVRDYMSPSYSVLARLRPGISLQSAGSEISTIQKRLLPNYTDAHIRQQRSDARLQSYADSLVAADLRKALLALLAASGVLWLIAAVNATNLMLARGAAREREIAMRRALGAGPWRIAQQFLAEGFVLSGAATLFGIGLALGAVRLSKSFVPSQLHVNLSIQVNITILASLCALTILTAIVSSASPAFLAVRARIEPALRQGSAQSGTARGHKRIRSSLVALEVAMSLALLVSCGLLLRTIYSLRHVPLGFRTDHIVVADLAIPTYRYEGQNVIANLYQPLLDRVKQVNGIQDAGLMSSVPLGPGIHITLGLNQPGKSIINTSLKPVTPGIQRIFRFPMLAGRFFDDGDIATSQPVVVVNSAFAQIYAPDKNNPSQLIGKPLVNLKKGKPAIIVGILNDQHQAGIARPSQPEVDFCVSQLAPGDGFYQPSTMAMDLVVRSDRPLESVLPELRSVLRQASPELANAPFTTMDQVVEDSFGSQRLAAHLLEFFAASALLLSVAGLYGLLAWVVTQRTREMGVRIALGARRANLLWLVLRQAGLMLLIGIAAGAALALSSARLLTSYLYGVSAHDGWTVTAAAFLLFVSGISAAWLPARRAARVDPMQALRAE